VAVTVAVNPRRRRFNGWNDPRYPTGFWSLQHFLTGTASGGLQTIIFRFWDNGVPLDTQMYSLEQLSLQYTDNVTPRPISIRTAGFDNLVSFNGQPDLGVVVLPITGPATGAIAMMTPQDANYFRGIFLGAPGNSGQAADLVFAVENTISNILVVAGQGYVWGPRSVLADGGPQRPPTGIYRT